MVDEICVTNKQIRTQKQHKIIFLIAFSFKIDYNLALNGESK